MVAGGVGWGRVESGMVQRLQRVGGEQALQHEIKHSIIKKRTV